MTDEEREPNLDELIAEMQAFELEGATKLTPRQYAQQRGVSPQSIYYRIRRGSIEIERCQCGRKVIDVEAADKVLGYGQRQDDSTE